VRPSERHFHCLVDLKESRKVDPGLGTDITSYPAAGKAFVSTSWLFWICSPRHVLSLEAFKQP